ncbi:hypothetical protein PAEPH01_0315 [Pancytospora epiphaga]|nr:hypothetical protein PAEPH01_0315 [Pancytospora epiphaga]
MGESAHRKNIHWSLSKMTIVTCLFAGSATCMVIGLKPFFNKEAEQKDLANIGFILLMLLFIFGFFKVRKESRFIFWAACFALILYSNVMFLFYETLFLE